MKHLFLFVILLTVSATSIGFVGIANDTVPGVRVTAQPESTIGPDSPVEVEKELTQASSHGGDLLVEDESRWFVADDSTSWTVDELRMLRKVLLDVVEALNTMGVDGNTLLSGYRFRRDPHHYADGVDGLMAKVDHNEMVITLSDTSFLRQQGFGIYHELGHAVDFKLRRRLSEGYHALVGSDAESSESRWQTADNYWIRQEGRDDREEAAADAFAVWVMVEHAGLRPPVFPRAPISTDYESISQAVETVLRDMP